MRVMSMTVGGILLGSLLAGSGMAQQAVGPDLRQPTSVRQTAFEYDDYLYFAPEKASASPSDAAPAKKAAAAPAAVAPAAGPACTSCNGGCESCHQDACDGCCRKPLLCGLFGECNLGEPWKLPQPCALACRNIVVGGWLDQGISFPGRQEPGNWNGVMAFNDRADEYMLNQANIFVKRDVDNGGCGFDIGGRADVMFGEDARYPFSLGLESQWGQTGLYQLAIPQFYVDVAYNMWTVRAGHFYTPAGYEVVTAPDNFFYSHSYTCVYGEPFTHTGALATRKLNDQLSFSFGVQRGWDVSLIDRDDSSYGFLGGLAWTSENEKVNVVWTVIADEEGADPIRVADPNTKRFFSSLVAKVKLSEKLTYVFQNDYGQDWNPNNAVPMAEWYGVNQYFLRQINDCWAAGLRFEWFKDANGTRVGGLGIPNYRNPAASVINPHSAGYAGDFYEVSAGLNWKPHANVVVRPELRWDWFDGQQVNAGLAPYVGDRNSQFSMAVDAIVTF